MTRKRTNGAAIGDNSAEEDEAALYTHFIAKIRAAERVAKVKKAEHDAAKGEVTAQFTLAKGELDIKRKEMEELLSQLDLEPEEFAARLKQKIRRYGLVGLPIGAQMELFPKQDTVDELQVAYEHGKIGGLAGDDPTPPKRLHPSFTQEWMKGYHDGQKLLGERTIRAMEIINARKEGGGMVDGDAEQKALDDEAGSLVEKPKRSRKAKGAAEPNPAFVDEEAKAEDPPAEDWEAPAEQEAVAETA